MDERGAPTPMEDKAHGLLKRDQRTREIHWLGPPCRMEEDKVHYRGAEVEGLQLSLGKSDARLFGTSFFFQPEERWGEEGRGVCVCVCLVCELGRSARGKKNNFFFFFMVCIT